MTTDVLTPIDDYLARQRSETAVERFSARHEADLLPPEQRWYADRLPVAAPSTGEQYAFRVDLDLCTGCKACVAGCHSLNGLDEGESWRFAGQLVATDVADRTTQTVPSGCHHCVDPACLAGCPTNAYEKDPITGIVAHLDDQCIGCSYCELTCPYEVPRFNKRLGIVRKCDMCADRLADGEAPACVQACPTSAITITVVETQEARANATAGPLVPGAPASTITTPTTEYVSAAPLEDVLVASDAHAVHLAKAHPPLSFMLVVTQLSVGAFLAALGASPLFGFDLPAAGAMAAAGAGVLALAASVLHLGRPLVAWRAVLGIGHSWLSREIVAFGLYAPLAVAYGLGAATGVGSEGALVALGASAAVAGLAGVGCSIAIYTATRRLWWRPAHTAPKFLLSGAITGPLLLAATLLLTAGSDAAVALEAAVPLGLTATFASLVKLGLEAGFLTMSRTQPTSDLGRTASLLRGPLSSTTKVRFAGGIVGGVVLPLATAITASGPDPDPLTIGLLVVVALATVLVAELVERWQFFVACVTPRMPGHYRP